MLTLILATVLTGSAPSAAALAARFVQVQQALPGEQPTYEGWTGAQLDAELRRIEEARPGVGGPIALISVGAGIAIVDFVVFLLGGLVVSLTGGSFPVPLIAGMSVFAVIAVGLVVTGAILLAGAIRERASYGPQLELVKAAIERLAPAPLEPPPNVPPPTPVPSPLQVQAAPVLIAVTLVRF